MDQAKVNLYWNVEGKTRALLEMPFTSESAFEAYLFKNQDILGGDVTIIYRQIRSGSKQGIPDMIGIDQDRRICIIELKNVLTDESILPQILSYAIWAETSPDSLKAIWLESERKPDEMVPDWDHLDLRLILVAPGFKSGVARMAAKIGYPIDLIQIRRFNLDEAECLLVESLDTSLPPKVITTKTRGEWDWKYYEKEHGVEATSQFRRVVEALAALAQRNGWDLQYNLNKNYVGFKLGNRLVFAVSWHGAKAWKVECSVQRKPPADFKGQHWELQRYDKDFDNAIFRPLNPETADVGELEPYLRASYKALAGK